MGVKALHVEYDAQEAINLLGEDNNLDKPLMPLIFDSIKLTAEFKKFKIPHIFWEAN